MYEAIFNERRKVLNNSDLNRDRLGTAQRVRVPLSHLAAVGLVNFLGCLVLSVENASLCELFYT